jgi:hypothetical protein
MRLVIRGIDGRAGEVRVPPSEIARNCRGEQNGCFKYDYSWTSENNVVRVTFTTRILISNSIPPTQLQNVRTHEQQHEQDFRRLAHQLKQSLEQALHRGSDPDIQNRLTWFDYDVCVAAANFHRRIGRIPAICLEPTIRRPR